MNSAKFQCNSCNESTDKPHHRGNGWIELILWLWLVVPGLIYSIWRRSGSLGTCPSCFKEELAPIEVNTAIEVRKSKPLNVVIWAIVIGLVFYGLITLDTI